MAKTSKTPQAEIEEEARKSEKALASFVKVNSAAKKTRLPDIQHHAFKKEVVSMLRSKRLQVSEAFDLFNRASLISKVVVEKVVLEDPAAWEQVMQAGTAIAV